MIYKNSCYEKPRTEDQEYCDFIVEKLSALFEFRLGRDDLGNVVVSDKGDEAENPLSVREYLDEELTGNWSYLVDKYNLLESLLITLSYGDQKDDPRIQIDTNVGRIFFYRETSYSSIALPLSLVEELEDWAIEELSTGGVLQ